VGAPDDGMIFVIFAGIMGLCFGSFANVVVYRLPRGGSIILPPSHCPACEKKLSKLDLVPVLSWLALRGSCRFCGTRISPRYPAVELSCAALFAGMVWFMGVSFSLVPLCLLAFVLLCSTLTDWDTMEILDQPLIFGAIVGSAWVIGGFFLPHSFPNAPTWSDALLGVLAGALPLFLIDKVVMLLMNKDGFGFGDVKLMAMAGLFLGWQGIPQAFFFAFVGGGIYGAFLLLTRRAERYSYVAFAPFLCAGVLISLWRG